MWDLQTPPSTCITARRLTTVLALQPCKSPINTILRTTQQTQHPPTTVHWPMQCSVPC